MGLRIGRWSLGPPGPVVDATPEGLTRRWLPRLRDAGWVLPPSLARDDVVPSWTRIGVVEGDASALVDTRGLVTTFGAEQGHSIDWWIGAEDRWYLPAREPGVTQVRLDHAPVVETTMRVPGGVVVHRAFGARGPARVVEGGDEWVVVEVENRSAVPVVVAWAVRPLTPTSLSFTQSVGLEPARGVAAGTTGPHVLTETGEPVGLVARTPSRWARGLDDVDPVHAVVAGDAVTGSMPEPHTFGELASEALLYPVPHTATNRIVLVPTGDGAARTWDDDGHFALAWPGELPSAEAIARGWTTLVEAGTRIEVPDPVLADAVAAARRSLVLSHRVERALTDTDQERPEVTHRITVGDGWGDHDPVDVQMEVLAALAWWGEHDAVDRALIGWPEHQQRGGGFGSDAATSAALRALASHAVAAGDAGPARAWLPELGGAVEWLGRRARRLAPEVDPLVVADGLDAGALLFAALDQPDAAARIAADAVAARGRPRPAATPPDPDAPSARPRSVAAAAVAATRAGADASAIWALLRRASSTWTWPDPDRWVGDDGLVQARLLAAVARLLVDDRPDGLALTTWMPPAWWGLGWEVHGAPSRWGRVSYAVRWHGDRPALLWEIGEPLRGVGEDLVVRVPGVDPSWSSTDRRGEALLAAVAAPSGTEVGPDPATGGVAVAAPPRSVWRPQDPGPDAPGPGPGPDAPAPAPAPAPDDEGTSFS